MSVKTTGKPAKKWHLGTGRLSSARWRAIGTMQIGLSVDGEEEAMTLTRIYIIYDKDGHDDKKAYFFIEALPQSDPRNIRLILRSDVGQKWETGGKYPISHSFGDSELLFHSTQFGFYFHSDILGELNIQTFHEGIDEVQVTGDFEVAYTITRHLQDDLAIKIKCYHFDVRTSPKPTRAPRIRG